MGTFSGICNNCVKQPVEIEFENARVMTRKDDSDINVLCFQCTKCGQECVSSVIAADFSQRYVLHGAQRIFWAPETAPCRDPLSAVEVEGLINVYVPDEENTDAVIAAATLRLEQEHRNLLLDLNGSDPV